MEIDDFQNEYYGFQYSQCHCSGAMGAFSNFFHREIERKSISAASILEVGAGTGEHIPFVSREFEKYTAIDLRDLNSFYESQFTDDRISFIKMDVHQLGFKDEEFDRIIATCILHHISDPYKALNEWRRVLTDQGQLTLYLPCDPGFLYRWVRHWTSHLKLKRNMVTEMSKVKFLWAIEHRNHILSLHYIIKQVFSKDEISLQRFPFRFGSWNQNIFFIYQIRVNKKH
jgi:ubiquinone/menaquinone biosynthesis C-methylase UbiE